MPTRRTVLGAGVAGVASIAVAGGLRNALAAATPRQSSSNSTLVAKFVSTPDLFNGDVADLSVLPNYDGGLNSINASWEAAIDKCLGAVAAHQPDAVFVAGDLVEGHWNIDSTDRRLFGRVSQGTDAASINACKEAISRAGNVYYGYYVNMFASRGLTLYPAVGDHDILDDRPGPLDDRWSPAGHLLYGPGKGEPDNRYFLVPHSKGVWAHHFTTSPGGRPRYANRPIGSAEKTAYAVNVGPKLTLITVDVFDRTGDGVILGVFGDQLAWLRRNIRAAKKAGRVVVVQGHIPIMVPFREFATGGLRVPQSTNSGLYQVLDEEGADFYFCGEVHDTTVIQANPGAPVQISHGSIFRAAFNYLVGSVYSDGTTRLDYYEMTMVSGSREKTLWASDRHKWARTEINYGDPVYRGTLVARNRQVLTRTDKLSVYDRADDPWCYAGHLQPTLT